MTEWLGRLWFPDTSRLDAFKALEAKAEDDGYRRGVVVRFAEPDRAKVQIERTDRRSLWWAKRG